MRDELQVDANLGLPRATGELPKSLSLIPELMEQWRPMNEASHNSLHPVAEFRISSALRLGRFGKSRTGAWLARFEPAIFIILLWTAVGLVEAIPETLESLYGWVFLNKFIEAWSWAILTPVILLIDRRLSRGEQNAARLAIVYLLLCVPFTLLHTYLAAVLLCPFPQITWSPLRNPYYTVFYIAGGLVTYCATVGILQSFKYYDRFRTSQLSLEGSKSVLSNPD